MIKPAVPICRCPPVSATPAEFKVHMSPSDDKEALPLDRGIPTGNVTEVADDICMLPFSAASFRSKSADTSVVLTFTVETFRQNRSPYSST